MKKTVDPHNKTDFVLGNFNNVIIIIIIMIIMKQRKKMTKKIKIVL